MTQVWIRLELYVMTVMLKSVAFINKDKVTHCITISECTVFDMLGLLLPSSVVLRKVLLGLNNMMWCLLKKKEPTG